jgi:hypothetical protein
MPVRHTATPSQSVFVGRTLSTNISQTMATELNDKAPSCDLSLLCEGESQARYNLARYEKCLRFSTFQVKKSIV